MRSMGRSMWLNHVVAYSHTGSIGVFWASSGYGDGLVHTPSSAHSCWHLYIHTCDVAPEMEEPRVGRRQLDGQHSAAIMEHEWRILSFLHLSYCTYYVTLMFLTLDCILCMKDQRQQVYEPREKTMSQWRWCLSQGLDSRGLHQFDDMPIIFRSRDNK